ncbi:MAG: adenylosuccinate lyase [Flavobacteriaceae bacterium]|nr:adenylosuccinate lyase [Flavobacteriaceae bacterium]
MTTETLYTILNEVNHSKENRKKHTQMVIDNPKLLPNILDIVFDVDHKISVRAAWLLEFTAREDLNLISPYLDQITLEMPKVHLDPAVRPIAKICEYITAAYFHKNANSIKDTLTDTHKERIIALSFDYLISDKKIAPQAYSMNTLFLLGKEFDWVHPELILILERGYPNGSPAYKARSRKLLDKLKK